MYFFQTKKCQGIRCFRVPELFSDNTSILKWITKYPTLIFYQLVNLRIWSPAEMWTFIQRCNLFARKKWLFAKIFPKWISKNSTLYFLFWSFKAVFSSFLQMSNHLCDLQGCISKMNRESYVSVYHFLKIWTFIRRCNFIWKTIHEDEKDYFGSVLLK